MDLSPPPPPEGNSWIRAWSSDDQLAFIAAVKKGVISAAHVYALYREIPPLPYGEGNRIMRGCRNFLQGGFRSLWNKKKALTTFLVLNIFTEVQRLLSKKTILFQGSRGGSTLSGEVQLLSEGGGRVRLLILYRNPYNLWFSCFPSESAMWAFR